MLVICHFNINLTVADAMHGAGYVYSIWGPFHKSSYERLLLYEFVEPVLNYRSNEFVALKNLCETGRT